MAAAWYVAAIKPQEVYARGAARAGTPPALARVPGSMAAMQLALQGFDVFFPTVSTVVIRRRRKVRALYPLFPGYIFTQFEIDEGAWRKINSTIGVNHLLPVAREQPLPLPDGLIDALREIEQSKNKLLRIVREFSDNALVRIITGPFAEFQGRVVNSGRNTSRVRIFALTGNEFVVNVSNATLTKIE